MLYYFILILLLGIFSYLLIFYTTNSYKIAFIYLFIYNGIIYLMAPFKMPFFVLSNSLSYPVSFLMSLLLKRKDSKKIILKGNKPSLISNVFEGILVTGAAGSGKTTTIIYRILEHYARYNFTGIIYDYKDFELTEIAYGLYKNSKIPFKCICFSDLSRSTRINPIAPCYIENEDTIRSFFQIIYENVLGRNTQGNPFFKHSAISAISALTWKIYEEDPQHCNIPFIVGLFTRKKIEDLADMIASNIRAKSLGSTFLDALAHPETISNIKASITNFLSFFLTPEKFFILGEDRLNLRINHKDSPCVLSIVNNPSYEVIQSPILASIIGVILKQMAYRDRMDSFLLLDEAPTLALENVSRIPATMRSYNVSTLYCIQDKTLSDELQGESTTRAILANLSSMYVGRCNDYISARMYENLSSLMKEKQKSINQSKNPLYAKAETRLNISERERHKIRASEFFKFKSGEFYYFSKGDEKKMTFPFRKIERIKPEEINLLTKEEIVENYLKVLKDCTDY